MAKVKNLREYHFPFASTDKYVSPVGYGTVKIGRNTLVKNACADGFDLPSLEQVKELLSICAEAGVNVIDTAPAYGTSEEVLGSALRGQRQRWFINTKVGEEFNGKDSQYDFSKAHTIASVERSLQRLHTDYIDSVMVHCHRDDLSILENTDVIPTLQQLKNAGKILSFGASIHTIEGGIFAVQHCDAVMVPYNIQFKKLQPVIEQALKLDRGIFVIKGLMQGKISEQAEVTIEDCFADIFALSRKIVALFGTINPLHLRENLAASQNGMEHVFR